MPVKRNTFAPNPFIHRLKLSFFDKIQVAFMSVTIFPIRFALAMSCITLICFFCFVATWSLPKVSVKPMTGWRKKIGYVVRGLMRAVFYFSSIHHIEVKGKENIDERQEPAIIIAAPHTTFFDPIMMFALNELPTGISRIENIEIPILGNVTKYFVPISVTRSDPDSRRATIDAIKRRITQRERYYEKLGRGEDVDNDPEALNWPTLFSFPEGSVGNGKYLMNFKYGAFIPGSAVQPITVRHYNRMHTLTWAWIGPSLFKILWLTLCQFQTTTVITILPSYTPSSQEKSDPKLFAKNVQNVLAESLGVEAVDVDFNDSDIFVYLSKLALQPLNVVVHLDRILKKISFREKFCVTSFVEKHFYSTSHTSPLDNLDPIIDCNQFKDILNQLTYCFSEHTYESGDGDVSLAQMLDTEEIFVACLEEEEDRVDIRRFLVWLCLCAQPSDTHYLVKLVFKLYGHNEHVVTREEMEEILVVLYQLQEHQIVEVLEELFNYGNQLTYGTFRAYSVNESNNRFRKYQKNFKRMFIPKDDLVNMPAADPVV